MLKVEQHPPLGGAHHSNHNQWHIAGSPRVLEPIMNPQALPRHLGAHRAAAYGQQGYQHLPVPTPARPYEDYTMRPLSTNCQRQNTGLSTPMSSEYSLRRKTPNGTLNNAYHSSLGHSYVPSQSTQPNGPRISPYGFNYECTVLPPQRYTLPYVDPLAQGQTTVIQYPGQPYGPTASASATDGRRLYGPYWHNGEFVPYRPQAVRDPRFYPHPLHTHDSSSNGFISPYSYPPCDAASSRPRLQTRNPSFTNLEHHNTTQVATPAQTFYPSPFSPPSPSSLPFFSEPLNFDPSSVTISERDRVYNLALQTYRELLSYLETAKKQHSQMFNGHTNTRPGIYPKPPPASANLPIESTDGGQRRVSDTALFDRGDNASQHLHTANAGPSEQSKIRSNRAGILEQVSTSFGPLQSQHPQSLKRHSSWMDQEQSDAFGIKRIRRTSASPLYSMTHSPSTSTAIARSKNALTTLSRLCLHTSYKWIDGINLCGCLAYGLGEYSQALDLYNRVLELDPKHIEAASNVAATLLALNRKVEAEQFWVKVVKQAPNYFEAVEHLIGLLCASGRGRDAIKVIDHVERALKIAHRDTKHGDQNSDAASADSRSSCLSDASDKPLLDYELDAGGAHYRPRRDSATSEPGFGSSGYAIPGCDNGRMLALVHAKGNMMYTQGDNDGAARSFEEVVTIATGKRFKTIKAVVHHVLDVIAVTQPSKDHASTSASTDPILLHPEQAVQVAKLCFPSDGNLPGLAWLPTDHNKLARKGAILTTSNSLLSLAKIFQDGMSTSSRNSQVCQLVSGVREILALYYLSLSLQPSPSTANNVGILLAGVQHSVPAMALLRRSSQIESKVPGVVPGSGIALALAYYNYGLVLDARHAHLYTNLGSLLKDIGQLDAAIEMYKRAVQCDGKFDIALANLANAVKDKGRISEAIDYYNRAVEVNPDFAEAVCGLANALNSVCRWKSRGGIAGGKIDRWHVDEQGMLLDASRDGLQSFGWIKRVVDIVEKQLADGEDWGFGVLDGLTIDNLVAQILALECNAADLAEKAKNTRQILVKWAGQKYEGARLVRLVERLIRRTTWQWYKDKEAKVERSATHYTRPRLPAALTVPAAPTVLPFHTFTAPMSAKQVRLISQRNGYRISASTLKMPWLPETVFDPPPKPAPALKVGYVSSDFNNHPLAHLMQSVFGLHSPARVECFCYATTASDHSIHREQIEKEAPHFHDASAWSVERLVKQIVSDGIHILINLNGYTRGARNEVFAARPAPIQMSFMGFAGTLGAEWCDYLLADSTAIPPSTLRPWRRNVDITDQLVDDNSTPSGNDDSTWVYGENIVYSRSTFFCCDHRQSAPDATSPPLPWSSEQSLRWRMRTALFPSLPAQTVILANFNQLYKIEPTTFRSWLRILSRVPNAILWLLRFPDLGEQNLRSTARQWAGEEVASRIVFTDVAPKREHIARAKIVDLFLDTPECNAHTTAADVLWSGTPLLTFPRYEYKMCSRMAASILRGALRAPSISREERERADAELVVGSDAEYEERAVALARGLVYPVEEGRKGKGEGRLVELRRMLTSARWESELFDTRRWVGDLEDAYEECWRRWVEGRGGDVWLDQVGRGRQGELP